MQPASALHVTRLYGDTPQRPVDSERGCWCALFRSPFGSAPDGAALWREWPRTHTEPAEMVSCAGDESRQAPPFRLHKPSE